MDIKVLGIDLGKTVCSLAGLDEAGAVVFRKRLQRYRVLDFLDGLPPCVVAMEACGGAHHIGRFCLQHGHEPRLMSPLYVRPYVKVHKNDDRDAEAIAEAATRPTMSFVAVKSDAQHDLQALHRARERLVTDRTRLINQGRGFLMERGIRVGTGRHIFQKELIRLTVEGTADLSRRMRLMLSDMASELNVINDRVAAIDAEIKGLARTDVNMKRLMEIPGVGPTIATALGRCRHRQQFWQGARSRRMARPRAAADHDWRQGEADRHLEARQPLTAQTLHPRSPNGAASRAGQDVANNGLGGRSERASACERRRGCHGQQDGAHRLGRVDDR
jgi:transposase